MCFTGPDAISAVHTYDERPGETIRTGYDLEKGMSRFGLGVLPICIDFVYFT